MGKRSNKSSRRRNSKTPKRASPGSKLPQKPTLSSKTEQLIATSQARRQELRVNVAALTHLMFRNLHLTAAVHQIRVARKSKSGTARLSPNEQLYGEVGASIVNELSQPLSAILSNLASASHLLGAESWELSEIFADVRADTLRACGIVQDMRELFGGKVTQKAPLQINAIVDNLVKTLSSEAQRRYTSLMADLCRDLPEVYADSPEIEQAITNLIWNGIDAMDDINPKERALVIATRCLGGKIVEISVSDKGTGISAHVLPHLFETYFTTKRDRMGLGLAVARSIAELHQGTITGENNRGRGATFRLRLPIHHTEDPAKPVLRVVKAAS